MSTITTIIHAFGYLFSRYLLIMLLLIPTIGYLPALPLHITLKILLQIKLFLTDEIFGHDINLAQHFFSEVMREI